MRQEKRPAINSHTLKGGRYIAPVQLMCLTAFIRVCCVMVGPGDGGLMGVFIISFMMVLYLTDRS